MRIFLNFSQSVYNCEVIIKDLQGSQSCFVALAEMKEEELKTFDFEVADGNFELTVIPQMADYKSLLSEMRAENWKDKVAKKVVDKLCYLVDTAMLRVGCKYNLCGLKENDTVYLCNREYFFASFLEKYDLFTLIPMAYMFFEASYNGCRCKITDAFGMNRKEVVSFARKITLMNFGIHLIFTYPFQVGRIKRLSSDSKIKKKMIEFNRMSEEQRQKLLSKWEKITKDL